MADSSLALPKQHPPRFAFRAVAQLGPQLVDDTFAALVEVLKCHGWWRET